MWERGWICYKAMLRNMGINLRGGDFRGIFAIPAKKKEYRAKKYCDIIKWLLGCCRFVQKKMKKSSKNIWWGKRKALSLHSLFGNNRYALRERR